MADGSSLDSRTGRHSEKNCDHGGQRCECPRRDTDPLARRHDHREQRSSCGHLANIARIDTAIGDPLVLRITIPRRGTSTPSPLCRACGGRLNSTPNSLDGSPSWTAPPTAPAAARSCTPSAFAPSLPSVDRAREGADLPFIPDGVPWCAASHPTRPHGAVNGSQRWICPGEVAPSGVPRHSLCHRPGGRTASFRLRSFVLEQRAQARGEHGEGATPAGIGNRAPPAQVREDGAHLLARGVYPRRPFLVRQWR